MRCSSHLSPALPASVLNALVDQLSGRDTAFERNTSQKFLKVAAQCVTCQVTSAVSRNISVLRKTIMKGDKTCCKQFRSMFLFIPEQISCNITIAGRIQLLFHHSAKVLPVVLCRLTLNISGVEVGQPSSRVLSGSLPLPQRTWRWVCARQTPGTPEGSGVLGWHFPPASAVSHLPRRCCAGNSSPVSQQTRGRARGSPKGAVRDNSGFPRRAGALHGAFFASQRKLINPFANPPFESYRWLMFIEVFYLELISLKSVLMFAKIHTVPVPSCARLLAPFFISAFFAYIVAGVKWGNAQSWEIKDVNFINRNQRS